MTRPKMSAVTQSKTSFPTAITRKSLYILTNDKWNQAKPTSNYTLYSKFDSQT